MRRFRHLTRYTTQISAARRAAAIAFAATNADAARRDVRTHLLPGAFEHAEARIDSRLPRWLALPCRPQRLGARR
jgi:hypothetical protein